MGIYLKPKIHLAKKITHQTLRKAELQSAKIYENYKTNKKIKIKTLSKKAGRFYAQELGFHPIVDQEVKIKNLTNEKIIQFMKQTDLTHRQLGWMMRASRPKITRVLNKNLKGVTLDFLLRILSTLGIQITINFKTT